MKSIKHRLLSLLLTLVTVLSLLPTAAFAASNTGSGLKITTNQAYWSTRLLANGTPYSYRPPLVDGKLVYCMDSGLGYHYATPSYLNSFTWTSGTGADADAVLQSALTNSGLSEMDAATVENVKWMMTYLTDCKESNVGQLFMAVQTYVWENQSYKGEPGGDGDAGGYANADTYDLYLSLIDWLLEQKSQEDAEFQRQIEEYTAQGKSASIVEDESAKWAVYAISSNRKNQSFFNYYGLRKLVTQDKPGGGGEEPAPPAGTGKIVLKKTAGGTTTGLAGARFSIYFNGQIVGSDVTDGNGEIHIENAATGLWTFVETAAPSGYCVDPTPKSVYVDVTEGDREYTVAAVNYEKPDMKIIKTDAQTGAPILGTVLSIKSVTGSYSTSVTTGTDGSATLSAIPAGVYVVREESVPEPYIVSNTEQTVALRPGKTSEVCFQDYQKPGLEILKKNIATGEPIEGVTYRVEQIDGSFSTSATTDNHGRIFLDSVPVGTFKVTEINVPNHVILCPIPQEVALKPGETSTVTFFNALKPTLEIRKVDSVTGDPIKGAKFQIWYGSNHTDTGELNDLGTYFSDASGKIILPEIKDGWYKVTELEPASGYAIKEPATQECFISGGESKVLTFENTPLSAIIIRKVDSESGQPLEGAWFRIRYLGGTSGTGGTVIGEYRTSNNGTIVVTGLKAGTYVCEEISAPDGYVITDATETIYLSGKDQDVITVTFGNDKMGSLLIVKKDAVTGVPISDVEFLVTDSDGSVIGTANGRYVTDSAGTIRIDGLTPGMTVIAKEVRAKDGYILDDTPQSIKIKRNAVMTLEFRNQPKGGVLVKKVDAVTNAPISDAEFLVTDSDGNLIGNANGKFVTDSAGTFTITDIAPGTTLIIKETRAKDGYLLDDTPQTVKVKSNEVVTVEFRNQPKGNLIIVKQDSVTKEPLEGVQFKITYADGSYVDAAGGTLSSTGLYWTDKAGKISISGISGTIVATEVKSIPGYTIDENSRTQTVVVNPNDTQTLYFYNTPVGGLQIIKSDKDSGKRISGVKFEIRKMNGEIIGTYTTDSDGVIYLPEAESGWYTVTELEAASGYLLDTTPHRIEVKDGQTATLEIINHKSSRILLHKVDKATGKGIYGAVFLLYDSNRNPIGEYVTDQDGYQEMIFEGGAVSEGTTPIISQKSIDEVVDAAGGQVKAYNTEHYGYAKSEQLHFLPGAGDSEASNMGQVTAVRDSQLTDVFLNEEYTLLAGRHIQPEDENKILISAELAAENSLEVGDVLTLTHAGLDQQDGVYIDTIPEKTVFAEVEIVGIFQCDGAADSADSPTAGKATNHIYSDSHLLINLQEQQEGVFEGEIAFYIADPLELDTLLERVEAIDSIDWDNHILRENDFQYEQIAGQLQNLQNLAVALIALAATLGIVILMLILMVQIRGRIREAGIYLSVGKPKMEIIGQFGLEAWGLLIVGFLSAFLLWLFCSGPVNGLLFGTLAQGTGTAALQTGGGGVNYLQPNLLNSGVLLAGELAAVLLTVLVASGAILRLKPKEILTKMS